MVSSKKDETLTLWRPHISEIKIGQVIKHWTCKQKNDKLTWEIFGKW